MSVPAGRRLVVTLYATCVGSLVVEPLVHRHGYFTVESWFGFYAALGFAAYCGIVYSAKLLRRLVQRPEDYYLTEDDRDWRGRDG